MRTATGLALAYVLVTLTGGSPNPVQGQEPKAGVVVTKTKLTFDPKTCKEGRGLLYWSFGSSAVKILGHHEGHCVFEYDAEVEMGHTVYLVRVPVDSGPVTVEAGTIKQGATSSPGILTSFPLDKAKVIRRGGPFGRWEVRVGDTDEFVHLGPVAGQGDQAARKGDTVKVQFRLFDGADFKRPLANATVDPSVEFVVGSGKGWPWLETALENLAAGTSRQVHVPVRIADGAKKWLPESSEARTLFVEVKLASVGRAK